MVGILHDRSWGVRVAEVLVEFDDLVMSEDGKNYTARACGAEVPGGTWQGWIEFVPLGDGEAIRSSRETTQPNRQDTVYWATGLTFVYLEGALHRALNRPIRPIARPIAPPHFDGPAHRFASTVPVVESVLDPFSVYRSGEDQLRGRLSALAGWHLVNIIRRYELSAEDPAILRAMDPAQLAELIVQGVRETTAPGL
jgi:hypothetical protein